jgi:hypothetical protein
MKRPGFQFRLKRYANSFFTLHRIFSDLTIIVIDGPEKITEKRPEALQIKDRTINRTGFAPAAVR